MRRLLPFLALVGLVLVAILVAMCANGQAPAADPWASGYTLDGWDRIAALQRYPVLDEQPPDWQAVTRDADPLVRTAAAMAIARAPDAALIPVLRPMLADEHSLVRRWALHALLEIRSPLIREPLLEVIANWDDLVTSAHHAFEFCRVGLPYDIATRPLQDRRQWVKEFAPAWTLNTAGPLREGGVWLEATVCPEASEIDAGEPIVLRFRVLAEGNEKWLSLSLGGMFAYWRAIEANGQPTTTKQYDLRHQFPHDMGEPKRDKIELAPGPNGPFDLTILTSNRPPLPGVYLFDTLHGATMLIRVRRAAEFERRIPDLLKAPLDADTAKTLGQQRVRAAVGPLVEAFRASGGSGPMTFAAAKALGAIGDPAAVPVLLDRPRLRSHNMFGDTSGALRMLGKAAWPECEKRIRSWRSRLSGERAYGLAMTLRLLGPNGSAATDRARQEMIRELAAELESGKAPNTIRRLVDKMMGNSGSGPASPWEDPRWHVLRAAVGAVAPEQPDLVVEAVTRLAGRPELAERLLREAGDRRCPPDVKEQIVRDLWALLKSRPGDDPLRTALTPVLSRMASHVFADERGPIASEAEALAAIAAAMAPAVVRKTPPKDLLRLRRQTCDRVEAWLKTAYAPPKDMMRFRLALARLYLAAERYETCHRLLDVPEDEIKEKSHKVVVATFRGMALKGLGRFDEAQVILQWAVDHTKLSTMYGRFSGGDIRRQFWEVWWMPRRDDLRIRTVYLHGMEDTLGGQRLWGSRVFGADADFRLKAADPLSEDGRTWTTMPQSPRDFAALDPHRVFVALRDRTAALFEEGKEQPAWRRPFSLAPESYLSAGPAVITAAEEDGTLHALDPATGKTLWTRKVKTSPWTSDSSAPKRSLLRQAGGVVLVPDQRQPTQLECVDAATGKSLWTVRPDAELGQVAVGNDLVVLGSGSGRVTALKRDTGNPMFEVTLCPRFRRADYRMALGLDPAGRRIYAAVDGTVWALDAASGRTLWQWTWQVRKAMAPPAPSRNPTPRLYPVEDGLFALITWSEQTPAWPSASHVVVVRFAADGTVLLHETSPGAGGHQDAFVAGNRLAILRRSCEWEVWEFLPAAP